MPTAQLRHPYTLAELVAAADTVCLPDEPLDEGTFDEDDNPEGYSDFVFDNNLELLYYGRQFADAVANTLHRKSGATTEDILRNLDHYLKHDTYPDF